MSERESVEKSRNVIVHGVASKKTSEGEKSRDGSGCMGVETVLGGLGGMQSLEEAEKRLGA